MKNAILIAMLLVVFVGGAALRAADFSAVAEKNGEDLVQYLMDLSEDGWVELLNGLDEQKGNTRLQVKVLKAGQNALNAMDKDAAAAVAARIESDVPSVGVGNRLDGSYVLFLTQATAAAAFTDQIYHDPFFVKSFFIKNFYVQEEEPEPEPWPISQSPYIFRW